MARKHIDRNTTEFLHITDRVHRRKHFPLPISRTWELMSDLLRFTQYSFGLEIVNFILMPNHYHILCRAPNGNIGDAIGYFNREFTLSSNRESGVINQLWGGRYFRTELRQFHYLRNVYKYIYQNPLRAGLVTRVEDYPYSTLRGLLGFEWAPLLVHDDLVFETKNIDDYLSWLNELPTEVNLISLRKALRRKYFQLPKINERPNPLETELF